MDQLAKGVSCFRKQSFPKYENQFRQLASGQSPHTLFITCSDSRVCPNLITSTEPGELFVVRNAGNIVPPFESTDLGVKASIEFAVKQLKVSNIVVCGHAYCGAVQGLLCPDQLHNLHAIRDWVSLSAAVRDRLEDDADESGETSDRLTRAVKANVALQLDHLRTYPFICDAEDQCAVRLRGWMYQFVTGDVEEFNPFTSRWSRLVETQEPVTA